METGEKQSATSLKKLQRYELIKNKKKERRKEHKEKLKLLHNHNKPKVPDSEYVSKKRLKQLQREKMENALKFGIKIVVDCEFEQSMSNKEHCKLAGQIRRLYGANLKATEPFHIYLTNMDEDGPVFKECCRQNDGFVNYSLHRTSESVLNLFSRQEIVWLSPDSEEVLDMLDSSKVYVISGLVDHQVQQRKSAEFADDQNICTARLPITNYLEKDATKASSSILTVNQVFEILLAYNNVKDWTKALLRGIPKRKGWVPKSHDVIMT